MSHGNVTSCENATFREYFTSFLEKVHDLSHGNFYFHGKLWHFTCKISPVAMHVHACRNEGIIEQYHSCVFVH